MSLTTRIDAISKMLIDGTLPQSIVSNLSSLREHAEALEHELGVTETCDQPSAAAALVKSLRTQIQDLKKQNQDLREENAGLAKTLETALAETKRVRDAAGEKEWNEAKHAEQQIEILVFAGERDTFTESAIGIAFEIGAQLVAYHLTEMQRRGWVRPLGRYQDPSGDIRWELAQAGRTELARLGRLK